MKAMSSSPVVGPPPQDPQQLLPLAREAAATLVAELERARQATRDWANETLSDALVDAALSACLDRLAASGCWGEANRLPSNEFWRIAGPVLEVGVLQRHARLKPRGYAGDFQMLHWICTNYCCDHPLGRVFDRYFQRQAAPHAVRSRTAQTAAALVDHCRRTAAAVCHVVSVGAGPADDVCQAVERLSEDRRARLRVTLLDLDPEALEFAGEQLRPLLPSDAVRCLRENLYRLPGRARCEGLLPAPDVLICSGLFDYLDPTTAAAMLRLFWQRLGPGGLMIVGNFAPRNPTRAYMEWIGNWYLLYRTAEEMRDLGVQVAIPASRFSIDSEPLHSDLLLIARKEH
jgi:hypothetical protein